MGKHKNHRTPQFPLPSRLLSFSRTLLDWLTCIYLAVVILGIPLYHKKSYAQIGSDKRNFFNNYLKFHSKALLVLLGLFLLLGLINLVVSNRGKLSFKSFLTPVLSFFKSFSIIDCFAGVFFLAVCVSALFTDYPDMAYLGASGWTMGTLMQLSLASGYFLISRLWKKRGWMVFLMLPVSFFLFALGCCNRFDLWPIPMEYSQNREFISLAGNINWYCGYLVTILFGAVYLQWSGTVNKPLMVWLLRGYLLIGFAALITNGSSSGVLTLLLVFFLLYLLSASNHQRMARFFELAFLFSLSCLVIYGLRLAFPEAFTFQESINNLFTYTPLPAALTLLALAGKLLSEKLGKNNRYPGRFLMFLGWFILSVLLTAGVIFIVLLVKNTLHPGSIGALSSYPILTFTWDWGSRRGITWMSGWGAWAEQPLFKKIIGVGPDCMPGYIYRDGSEPLVSLLRAIWPTVTLANAHNEWLTVLVNLGLFGAISYIGLILSAVILFLRKGKEGNTLTNGLIGACGLSILAYTLNNMVSFQQVLNLPAMFVILGIGTAYLSKHSR